jgi:hypothetical protein
MIATRTIDGLQGLDFTVMDVRRRAGREHKREAPAVRREREDARGKRWAPGRRRK